MLLLLALAASRASLAYGEEQVLNPKCPVLTDQKTDPALWTEYQGKKVWFCCNMCRKKFIKNPEAYLANLPQFTQLAAAAGKVSEVAPSLAPAGPAASAPATPGVAASTEVPPPEETDKWVEFLGNMHPIMVHFPIALALCAAAAEVLYLFSRKRFFTDAARFMLWLAAAAGVVAAGLGWAAADDADFKGALAAALEWHRWLGTASAGLILLTMVLREVAEGRPAVANWRHGYLAVLLLSAVVIASAGYFGGVLVYGPEHFAWPK